MSAHRPFLIQTLREIVAGGDVTGAWLAAAIPNPKELDRGERAALSALSHWADDGDIRAQNLRHGPLQRNMMAEMARRLEAD
ncbi:MAG: hypothetical protein WDN45_15425 [Caulobacteraceae bacterium]